VFAKDETKRVSAFVVPTSASGFELREPCETLGLRGFGACMIYLDSVRVPKGNLVGEKGAATRYAGAISVERVGVAPRPSAWPSGTGSFRRVCWQRIAYEKPSPDATIQWLSRRWRRDRSRPVAGLPLSLPARPGPEHPE